MKLEKIQREVAAAVDERYYDSVTILEFINRALQDCCGKVDVPELKRLGTANTEVGQSYTYLSDSLTNFGGRVRRIKYDGEDLAVYGSLDELLDNYTTLSEVGDIEACAVEGRLLWYAKQPEEATDLLILYFLNPDPLTLQSNNEVPWMPESVQHDILVHGAASMIWDDMEEEDSGYPMTRKFESRYLNGLMEFKQWISRNRQNLTYNYWSY